MEWALSIGCLRLLSWRASSAASFFLSAAVASAARALFAARDNGGGEGGCAAAGAAAPAGTAEAELVRYVSATNLLYCAAATGLFATQDFNRSNLIFR